MTETERGAVECVVAVGRATVAAMVGRVLSTGSSSVEQSVRVAKERESVLAVMAQVG